MQVLEDELCSELRGASAARACDLAESGIGNARIGIVPLGCIHHCEALGANLELHTLPDREGAEYGGVQIPEARTIDHVPSQVAEFRQAAVFGARLSEAIGSGNGSR